MSLVGSRHREHVPVDGDLESAGDQDALGDRLEPQVKVDRLPGGTPMSSLSRRAPAPWVPYCIAPARRPSSRGSKTRVGCGAPDVRVGVSGSRRLGGAWQRRGMSGLGVRQWAAAPAGAIRWDSGGHWRSDQALDDPVAGVRWVVGVRRREGGPARPDRAQGLVEGRHEVGEPAVDVRVDLGAHPGDVGGGTARISSTRERRRGRPRPATTGPAWRRPRRCSARGGAAPSRP